MQQAFNEMKKMNGGIVIVEDEEVVCTLNLPIGGILIGSADGTFNRRGTSTKKRIGS